MKQNFVKPVEYRRLRNCPLLISTSCIISFLPILISSSHTRLRYSMWFLSCRFLSQSFVRIASLPWVLQALPTAPASPIWQSSAYHVNITIHEASHYAVFFYLPSSHTAVTDRESVNWTQVSGLLWRRFWIPRFHKNRKYLFHNKLWNRNTAYNPFYR
jgi:hypothetical protein